VLGDFPLLRLVSPQAALAPHMRAGVDCAGLFDARGCFRTFPPRHGTDGFFAATLEMSGTVAR